MELRTTLFTLALIVFGLSSKLASGQVIDTIYGCDYFPASIEESNSCLICDYDFYYGTTSIYTPGDDTDWCGTIENDQYIGFIAGPTGSVVFELISFNCTNGGGLQVGIYDSNNTRLGVCYDQTPPDFFETYTVDGLSEDELYYIRIDGFAGDLCDFNIRMRSGLSSNEGRFEIDVINGQSVILYVQDYCPSAPPSGGSTSNSGCSYRIDYRLEPDSLTYNVLHPPGLGTYQVITWPDSMDQRVLLIQELNLTAGNPSRNCSDSLEFPYYSHFLDLTNNDLISAKASECDADRIVGLIDPERDTLTLIESGIQTYTISGAGFHALLGGDFSDHLFSFSVHQGSNVLFGKNFSELDAESTFTVDYSQGEINIRFYNPYPWPMEVALERSAPRQPWTIRDIVDDRSYCPDYVGFGIYGTGFLSPAYGSLLNSRNPFKFELISATLVDSAGTSYPTNPTLSSSASNSLIRISNIATHRQLAPGDYVFTGIIRPLDDLTALCGLNDSFEYRYEINIKEPLDTIVRPNIRLSDTRDSVVLFSDLHSTDRIETNVPGTYYALLLCDVIQQTLLPPLITINLGEDTLCAGECLFAPTGEMISCTDTSYAFLASNDTTYLGQLVIDNSQPLSIDQIEYECDSTSGQFFINLDWSGSQAPYSLGSQVLINSTGSAGPFQSGELVDIVLAGSSPCIDSLFIQESFSCVSGTTTTQSLGFEITQVSTSLLEVNAPAYGWELILVDILGREVLKTHLQRNANQLFVGDLVAGTYFIVVQNGKERATEKWVKR